MFPEGANGWFPAHGEYASLDLALALLVLTMMAPAASQQHSSHDALRVVGLATLVELKEQWPDAESKPRAAILRRTLEAQR